MGLDSFLSLPSNDRVQVDSYYYSRFDLLSSLANENSIFIKKNKQLLTAFKMFIPIFDKILGLPDWLEASGLVLEIGKIRR